MPLGDVDLRKGPAGVADRLGRMERAQQRQNSSARPLRRGSFADASIPESALQSPAAPALLSSLVTGMPIAIAGDIVLVVDVPVPARMTRATVFALARVYAVNSTGTPETPETPAIAGTPGTLLARTEVNEFAGNAFPVPAAPGAGALNLAPVPVQLTGLQPGQVIQVRVWAQVSNEDWPADPSNMVELSGQVSWWA